LVEAGPDLQRDGVVRWRRIDLQARIKALFGVQMHERTVGKQLVTLGFRRLSVRPRHPKTDEGTQEAFKKLPGGGSGGASRSGEGQSARGVVSR
jgi:transposase